MKNKVNRYFDGRLIAKMLCAMILMTALLTFAVPAQKAYAMYSSLDVYTVRVEKGYLALRTAKAYDRSNEIGELNTGDVVIRCPSYGDDNQYWYVYSPKLRRHGYVNADYIYYRESYDRSYKYARVETGYLALRTAKAYDSRNEIGKLYTGDPVIVLDDSDYEYWTVYAPTLYQTGYVNCNYLVNSFGSTDNGMALGFPDVSNMEWISRPGDYMDVHVQVHNYSNSKTVSSFTVMYSGQDRIGTYVDECGRFLFEETVYKTISPGETAYTDYLSLPCASRIKTITVQIESVRFTDGSRIDYPIDSQPYAYWTLR